MFILRSILAAVVFAGAAVAQDYPPPRLRNEGSLLGPYYSLDCVGPAVNCTMSAGQATMTIDVESADISNLTASDTQVLFRDGAGISGDADFVYDKTTNRITATGDLKIPNIGLGGANPDPSILVNVGDRTSSTIISPLASRLVHTGTSPILASFQSTAAHTGAAIDPTVIGALVGGFAGTNNTGISQYWGLYADTGFFDGSQTCDAFEFCVFYGTSLNPMPVTRIGGTHSPLSTIITIGAYIPPFGTPVGMGALIEHGILLGETLTLTANTKVGYDGDAFVVADTVTYFDNASAEWRVEINGSERLAMTSTAIGFHGVVPYARPAAYVVTNGVTDRSYDANATSTAELADVLFTLISDLQSYGLLQ